MGGPWAKKARVLVELHMRSRFLANLTDCILFEVTGRKGDSTHAWAFPASALVTLETAGRSRLGFSAFC